jgi:hypothetical protein
MVQLYPCQCWRWKAHEFGEGKQNEYVRRVREMYKNDTRESVIGGD